MAPADRRVLCRALVAGLVVLSIGLAGCGRQGALDPPPGAAVTNKTTSAPTAGPEKPNKPFFLDWLL